MPAEMPLIVRSLSTWLKIALVVLSLGVILFVVGFATEAWMVAPYYHHHPRYNVAYSHGLWKFRICDSYNRCSPARYGNVEDFHKATQAMECLGLIAVLLALLLLILYCFVDSCRRREALLAATFFIFASVVFIVIGIIVFATKMEERGYEVGWSMGVTIAGAILIFISGVFCILQIMAR